MAHTIISYNNHSIRLPDWQIFITFKSCDVYLSEIEYEKHEGLRRLMDLWRDDIALLGVGLSNFQMDQLVDEDIRLALIELLGKIDRFFEQTTVNGRIPESIILNLTKGTDWRAASVSFDSQRSTIDKLLELLESKK